MGLALVGRKLRKEKAGKRYVHTRDEKAGSGRGFELWDRSG